MLKKRKRLDHRIVACLRGEYGLTVTKVTPLPVGVDRNAAVYRIDAEGGAAFFLKLRTGAFDEVCVALPKFLSDQGIKQIIAPLSTKAGQLSADLDDCRAILYPFVEGQDGYRVRLSERQWYELGAALKQLHSTAVPPALADQIRSETYSPRWHEAVRTFLEQVEGSGLPDQVAAELAALLNARRHEILDLVARAEGLAESLQAESPPVVLCHSDVHAANILIDAEGALYIVDWDDPIRAPKERDLMFIGGAQGYLSGGPRQQEKLFYRGYGQTDVNQAAMAYYRYERVVEDIAVFTERILLAEESGEDRVRYLTYVASNFLPEGPVEMAHRSQKAWNAA